MTEWTELAPGHSLHAQAGGQAVGALLSLLNPTLPVPPHLVSSMRLMFPSAGPYLILASPTVGTTGTVMLVTVVP